MLMKEIPTEMSGYPIGQQDFKTLRERGAIYVDKTGFIHKIVESDSQYYFLARPRRFGKSLFLSTMRYFFQGERELFKGLYIDSTDWKWEEHPVLYLDLNTNRYMEKGKLEAVLDNLFREWEKRYGISEIAEDYGQRFSNIIKTAHKKTGRQVVVLVDEYDKPLVGNLNKQEMFGYYRMQLASIYSNFKSSAEHIRLVFLTGVSRFSKLSVFSDLNNIRDITFSDEYADICGITEKELHQYFKTGIGTYADREGISYEEACAELKINYDGYCFSRSGSDIYNPWSVLNAMQESSIEDYWVRTGTPTIIAEVLRDRDVDVEKILNTECRLDLLQGLDLSNADPLALLYQTGYITIKGYDRSTRLYRLGVPNREVSRGLFNELLPYYVSTARDDAKTVASDILTNILKGEPSKLMKNIDIFLGGIPYGMKMENENNFHNAVYILLRLIGAQVETEVMTSDGRMDLLIRTGKFIYIIELKYGRDAEAALSQIEEKEYFISFLNDPRPIFCIGANFNPSTRRLDAPAIEEIKK